MESEAYSYTGAQASGLLFLVEFLCFPDFQLPGKRENFEKFLGNFPEFRKFLEIRKITRIISRNLINLIICFVGNFINILTRRFLKVSAFIQYRKIKNFKYILCIN